MQPTTRSFLPTLIAEFATHSTAVKLAAVKPLLNALGIALLVMGLPLSSAAAGEVTLEVTGTVGPNSGASVPVEFSALVIYNTQDREEEQVPVRLDSLSRTDQSLSSSLLMANPHAPIR